MLNRKELVDALQLLKHGTDSNLTLIYFDGKHIKSNNRRVSVCIPFEHDLEGSVKFSDLHTLMTRVQSEEVQMTMKEGYFHIKAGKSKAKIKIIPEPVNIPSPEEFVPLPDNFMKGLQACYIPKNTYNLEGVVVDGKSMICTNGILMNMYDLPQPMDNLWLNTPSVRSILDVGDIFTHISFTESHIFLKTIQKAVLSFQKLYSAKYPLEAMYKYRNALSQGDFLAVPPELKEAVYRACALEPEDKKISLTFSKEGITIESRQENADYVESIEGVAYPDNSILVNMDYLVSLLQKGNQFSIDTSSKPIISLKGENSFHILLGMQF